MTFKDLITFPLMERFKTKLMADVTERIDAIELTPGPKGDAGPPGPAGTTDYNNLSNKPTSMNPTSHASSGTTYGAGSGSSYGHVKLSDATTSTSGASSGVAATPYAVKQAYDLANGKAAKSHAHAIADVSNLQSKLDEKLSKTDDINIDGGTF